MKTRKLAGVALVAWWSVACADGEPATGGEWAGSVTDSAGIEVVANPPEGTWTDADRWTLTEDLRIGASGGEAIYQFGRISGIAPLPDGRLVVVDQQAQEVRIFSPGGEHLRTLGGPGSGPGEFGNQAGPALIGVGDTIYIPDLANQRVNRFTPEGEPLGSFALDLSAGFPIAWQDDGTGRIVSQTRPLNLPGQPADSMDLFVRRGAGGAITDTLFSVPSGRTFSFGEGGPSFQFFSPEPVWALVGDSRLLFGMNDAYSLTLYGPDGTPERIIRMAYERRPVTDADQGLITDGMVRLWREFGLSGPQLDAMRAGIGFAEFYPAFATVQGGPAGSIWVQHLRLPGEFTAEERENFNPQLGFGSSTWDVFDPEGRYLGRIEMPDRFQPLRFVDDRIYGIWRDELDVQYVLILRLLRGDTELVG